MHVTSLIKTELFKQRRTQKELAQFLNISQKALSEKINQKTEFTYSELLKVQEFLNIIFFV